VPRRVGCSARGLVIGEGEAAAGPPLLVRAADAMETDLDPGKRFALGIEDHTGACGGFRPEFQHNILPGLSAGPIRRQASHQRTDTELAGGVSHFQLDRE